MGTLPSVLQEFLLLLVLALSKISATISKVRSLLPHNGSFSAFLIAWFRSLLVKTPSSVPSLKAPNGTYRTIRALGRSISGNEALIL